MSETVVNAETGREIGSGFARRLRDQGKIPAVVYGQGMGTLSLTVDRRELRRALSGPSGVNTVLDLTVDGTVYPSLVKDIQRHPVRKTVLHVDFIQINLSEEVIVSIPIHLEGEAEAVQQEGGLVEQALGELEISATPGNIPNEVIVDISAMDMDTTITVGDLTLPAGVTATDDADRTVVTATYMATPTLDEEEAAAEAAAEEGAAEAGAEGDDESKPEGQAGDDE